VRKNILIAKDFVNAPMRGTVRETGIGRKQGFSLAADSIQFDSIARVPTRHIGKNQTYASPVPSGNRLFIKDQDSVTLWTLP